jgi:hypothetical protein
MNEEGSATAHSTASAQVEEDGAFPNLLTRFVQVFISPGALFERLRERPVWVGAVILIVLLSIGSNLLLPDAIMRQALEQQMGSEATAERVDRLLSIVRVWGRVASVAFPPLVIAAISGILILIYNVFTGGEAKYRQLFSASAHAFFIYTVGGIVTLALILARGEVLSLSLNLVLPGLEEGYLFRLLHGLNVFSLWTAAVLGVAVSRIYPGRSAGRAAGVIIGLYAVLVAVFALFGGAG